MTRVILDPDLIGKLLNLEQPLELCDEAGHVLARVLPVVDPALYEDLEPQISREELDRRKHELHDCGGASISGEALMFRMEARVVWILHVWRYRRRGEK